MATFGEFFERLRRRCERTGRTDAACIAMDNYKDKRRTERAIPFGREDRGWKKIARKELSCANLLEFSAEMTRNGLAQLTNRLNSDTFNPETFSWSLDSVHEFHHTMLDVARECGLDVNRLSNWRDARESK